MQDWKKTPTSYTLQAYGYELCVICTSTCCTSTCCTVSCSAVHAPWWRGWLETRLLAEWNDCKRTCVREKYLVDRNLYVLKQSTQSFVHILLTVWSDSKCNNNYWTHQGHLLGHTYTHMPYFHLSLAHKNTGTYSSKTMHSNHLMFMTSM